MGRRERRRDEMRDRLLSAALELFVDRGYAATTIDAIAERADVARQTLFNYFPLKEDLVGEWGQRRRDHLEQVAAEAGVGTHLRERLHRCYAALAAVNSAERELTTVLRSRAAAGLDEHPVPSAVHRIVEQAAKNGELREPVDPAYVAEALTALYFDALDRWLADDTPRNLARALHNAVDLVLDGILA